MKQILPKTLLGILLLCRIHWSSSSPRRQWTYPKKNKWKASWFPSKNATTTPRPFDPDEKMLFDFRIARHTDDWYGDSEGNSEGNLILAGESKYLHGAFLVDLDPMDEETAIARSQYHYLDKPLNMTGFHYFQLHARAAQTKPNIVWKIFLRHNGERYDHPCYEGIITVPEGDKYKIVQIPLVEFKPMFENKPAEHAPPLNKANITMIGIQGQSSDEMAAAMHINWIKASKVLWVKPVIIVTTPPTTTPWDIQDLIDKMPETTPWVSTTRKYRPPKTKKTTSGYYYE
ncbi:hypothetical protein WDU94_006086 [Cyamophila willieti]